MISFLPFQDIRIFRSMRSLLLASYIFGDGCEPAYTKLKQKQDIMKLSEKKEIDQKDNNGNQLCHSLSNGAINSIHRIQEVQLAEINMSEIYDIKKVLAEGCYARVTLANHKNTDSTVVLKSVYGELTPMKDFFREYHYSYHLSPHPNILDSYNVSFKCDNCYVFAQEYAPYGDLAGHVKLGGLPESICKLIGNQLSSALDFMHSKELVHRDLKLENVLIFAPDYSKVKLCDFGATRKEGTLVSKLRCTWLPFLPPEIYETIKNEKYICKTSSDSWQLGIILFVCLTGCPPWQMADSIQDPNYSAFWRYQKRRTTKIPIPFKKFSPRALRMFRRVFEHKPDKRAPVTEVSKYMKDSWIENRLQTSSSCSQIVSTSTLVQERKDSIKLYLRQQDGSKNSQENNRNKLNKIMNTYGLESTVDQKAISKRVWEWVLSCDVNAELVEGI